MTALTVVPVFWCTLCSHTAAPDTGAFPGICYALGLAPCLGQICSPQYDQCRQQNKKAPVPAYNVPWIPMFHTFYLLLFFCLLRTGSYVFAFSIIPGASQLKDAMCLFDLLSPGEGCIWKKRDIRILCPAFQADFFISNWLLLEMLDVV